MSKILNMLSIPYSAAVMYDLGMGELRPQVGVGLLLVRGNKILLGRRKGAHGAGEYGGPGGHLELDETIEQGILRELEEEAGRDLKIRNLGFLCFLNLRRYAPKHYAHIHMRADWESGEPVNMEPEKKDPWGWYDIDHLPSPLFGTTPEAVEAYKTGRVFFEA